MSSKLVLPRIHIRILILARKPLKRSLLMLLVLKIPQMALRPGVPRRKTQPLALNLRRQHIARPRNHLVGIPGVPRAPRHVPRVIRCELVVWFADALVVELGVFGHFVGAGHGAEDVLLGRVIRHGGAMFGHFFEGAAFVGVLGGHFAGL